MKKNFAKILICFFFLISAASFAQRWDKVVSLRGYWKFSIGDDLKWAKPEYDDKSWEDMVVPSSWQEEGFHGYHGYAWYRKHFNCTSDLKGRSIVLKLGRVDDVDQVYINGYLIGSSGTFPPKYQSAWNAWREYPVPEKYLNIGGSNVIAIRVYDSELEAGIVDGEVGLFENRDAMKLDIDLAGQWKFQIGDNMDWKEKKYDDKKWSEILVPSQWETQGYKDYDGFAWYRTDVIIPGNSGIRKWFW